ncbi:hypothetical protein FRC03_012410 [Tulasnella sp. 419]|nr:hypothetical protein FRC03_012410 [Tulasnella sp. 419]
MKRTFLRPPQRSFPQQRERKPKVDSATALFERVTALSRAQHENLARECQATPPAGWHDYHPTPPMSPVYSTLSLGGPGGPSLSRYSSSMNLAEPRPESPTFVPSPYPPPAPVPDPNQRLASVVPVSAGSTSTIFRTVIKRPAVVQLYLNDELHSNAPDVEVQYLAELRAFHAAGPHANIVAFLGCLDGVGMVLECIDGDTLYDRVMKPSEKGKEKELAVTPTFKIEWFNQLVEALVHVHNHGLSHGDINTLNVLITHPTAHPPNVVKLIDFGRSSWYAPPGSPPSFPPSEIPQVGAHPFAAPEILRGGKVVNSEGKKVPADGRLGDAYSLGMLLWCLDEERLIEVQQSVQKKEEVDLYAGIDEESDDDMGSPVLDEGYHSGANEDSGDGISLRHRGHAKRPSSSKTRKPRLFSHLIRGYLKKYEERTRISLDQRMPVLA